MNEAVFIHDAETGEILDVNLTACRMFGYDREELRRMSVEQLSSGETPFTQEQAMELMRRGLASEPVADEWHAKHRSGRLFWAEVNARPVEIRGQTRLLVDSAGQIVVVQTGNTDIKGYADLTGKTVAAQLGTTGAIEAEKIADVTFKPYDSYDLAFLDLQNGQVDAVIVDYLTAVGFLGKNPGTLQMVGEVFTDESYGIAVCKNKTDLLDKINAALKALTDEGKIKELETKFLAGE